MDIIKISLQIFFLVYLASNAQGNVCSDRAGCTSKDFSNKTYYLFLDKERTWEDSKEFCKENELQLAAVPEELRHIDFLKSFDGESEKTLRKGRSLGGRTNIHTQQAANVWLGGIVKDFHNWHFVNGEKFYQTPDGAPIWNYEQRRCGQLNRLGDRVQVVSRGCDTAKNDYPNYICRIGNEPRIYKKNMITWFQARKKCLQFGGDLYYLTKSQLDAFKNLTTELKPLTENGQQYLVGFKTFRAEWIDGSEILDYIPNVKPSDDYYCISMDGTTGILSEGECSVNRYTLCQKYSNASKVHKGDEPGGEEEDGQGEEVEEKDPSNANQTSENQDCRNYHTDICVYVLAALLALSLLVALALGCYIIRKKLQGSKAAEMDDLIEMEDNPEYGTACTASPVPPYHRATPKRPAGPVAPVAPVVAYEEVTLPNSTSSTRYNGRTVSEVEAAEQETSIYSLAK